MERASVKNVKTWPALPIPPLCSGCQPPWNLELGKTLGNEHIIHNTPPHVCSLENSSDLTASPWPLRHVSPVLQRHHRHQEILPGWRERTRTFLPLLGDPPTLGRLHKFPGSSPWGDKFSTMERARDARRGTRQRMWPATHRRLLRRQSRALRGPLLGT